jgi:DNA-binding winged helix-turn-helix (wHTH) protein
MPDKKAHFDDFELDFSRFQLYRNAQPVRLEGLPLQLLMFLIEHRQQLVTREQIAAKLWGEGVFVDAEQGINTAIRKIRLALRDDYVQPRYLRTVVGRGYRFVADVEVADEAAVSATGEKMFSAEELGQAVMAAAGLDPSTLNRPLKPRDES